MGYVVRRTYTVIRGKNFVRIRRQFLRAARELDALGYVPWWRARTLCAFWGQLKYTDSIYFCQTYDAYRIFKAARRSVAWKARKEAQRGAVCQAAGIEALPETLKDAMTSFENSSLMREVLGDHIFSKYLEAKNREWKDFRAHVTDWEVDEYLYKY